MGPVPVPVAPHRPFLHLTQNIVHNRVEQWLNDTVWVAVPFLVSRLNAPDMVQVQVVDSGLGLSWQDRSNYETRYMLKIRAFSWNGDTLEGAKYLTGTNGTSGFVTWGDAFWDFIPAGTAGVEMLPFVRQI